MSLFERFLNPLWIPVESLCPEDRLAVASLIVTVGGWRSVIDENFVGVLIERLSTEASRVADSRPALRAHASAAILACARVPDGTPPKAPTFNWFGYREALQMLIASEEAKYLKELRPGYSSEPATARTQLLVRACSLVSSTSPDLAQRLARGPIGEAWAQAVQAGLSGMALAIGRVPDEVVLARAKRELAGWSRESGAFVKGLCQHIAAQR